MEREVLDRVGSVERRLVDLVDAYARRVYPAVLTQHEAESVSSPLGVWLLLAAVATASRGEHRRELERSLGCSAEQASGLLAAFMSAPPPALKAAMAVWVAIADDTEAVGQWARGLTSEVETGFMPTQDEAGAWADRTTDGLIKAFPMSIDDATRIVLASALATRVSWSIPLDVVPAAEHLAKSSPWHGKVERLLWDDRPELLAKLVNTRSAGIVAVHFAAAVEGVTVISVSAEPGCPRVAVLEAAHEVVAVLRDEESAPPACSLFDLPIGPGHSWNIKESAIATWTAGERIERIDGVSLPTWTAESTLDLKRSETFGAETALEVMRQLIGPRPDDQTAAGQAAVASFTRFGFAAAAITFFGIARGAQAPPPETGFERVATLRFDHPYAAIAVAGHVATPEHDEESSNSAFAGLPLFTAWIDTPLETSAEDPPAGADF